MGKLLARLGFVALTFSLGIAYGLVSNAQASFITDAPNALQHTALR